MNAQGELRRDARNRGFRVLIWGLSFDLILLAVGGLWLVFAEITTHQKNLLGYLILICLIKTWWIASVSYLVRRFWV